MVKNLPVAEPTFNDVSHLVRKFVDFSLVLAVVVGVVGKSWFDFWVGDGEGDGDGERLSTFLIGSVAGNVSLICGDFSADADGFSSIFNGSQSNEKQKYKKIHS